MARTPNDDRSDSMNPNNDAYDASERNRENQIGANDDDDDDWPSRSRRSPLSYYSEPAFSPRVSREEEEEIVLDVIIRPQPVRVKGLHLLIVSNDETRRCVKVDAASIEEAVNDAKTIWDSKPLAYLALYDQANIYLEQTRSKQFSPDVVGSIQELSELNKLIAFAADHTSSARRSLGSVAARPDGQHALGRFLESYGASYSALQGLYAERSGRIEELRAKGQDVTEETAEEFGKAGRLAQVVGTNVQWVRDFQSGKTRLDPMTVAFSRPERVLDVKA
ncbi:hypothetical protein BTHE68_71740 (plasmid) [Burkholderia sp. THE68]|uniref:hypothetical protein n=1 Tax=Burkholderia sp. THE68 TaxID=758782 RepID=UPI0013165AC3|nr:hypothetical protein [Burkholderia sp. THE68]BBU33440.1 hypothetical protein BTHE68_71740 [Burkholderia sp. THE68]